VSTVKGVIEKVSGPNKGGYYAIKVGGTFYGISKKGAPDFAEGATVEFDSYLKDGKYATVKGDITAVKAEQKSGSGSTGYVNPKDAYWEAKDAYDKEVVQPRITYLAAYERAVGFATLAISSGALNFEKAKPAEKLGILEAFVEERTAAIVAASNGGDSPAGTEQKEAEPTEEKWE